jgi:hypothetical protein
LSDGSSILSHGGLLKQKILTQSRGENSIHAVPPDLSRQGTSLKPVTGPAVPLTHNSQNQIVFRLTLAGGFHWGSLVMALNLSP